MVRFQWTSFSDLNIIFENPTVVYNFDEDGMSEDDMKRLIDEYQIMIYQNGIVNFPTFFANYDLLYWDDGEYSTHEIMRLPKFTLDEFFLLLDNEKFMKDLKNQNKYYSEHSLIKIGNKTFLVDLSNFLVNEGMSLFELTKQTNNNILLLSLFVGMLETEECNYGILDFGVYFDMWSNEKLDVPKWIPDEVLAMHSRYRWDIEYIVTSGNYSEEFIMNFIKSKMITKEE